MAYDVPPPSAAERARLAAQAGLCAACRHLQVLSSKRSTFVRCGRSDADPAMPKYPILPVLQCRGFEPEGREPDRG